MGGLPTCPWGAGVKNLIARNAPDMLGSKRDMKQVPMRALKVPTISKSTAFRSEAIRDDGRSPNPLVGIMADFRVDVFSRFLDFWGPWPWETLWKVVST